MKEMRLLPVLVSPRPKPTMKGVISPGSMYRSWPKAKDHMKKNHPA
jgi:hypothetical protein